MPHECWRSQHEQQRYNGGPIPGNIAHQQRGEEQQQSAETGIKQVADLVVGRLFGFETQCAVDEAGAEVKNAAIVFGVFFITRICVGFVKDGSVFAKSGIIIHQALGVVFLEFIVFVDAAVEGQNRQHQESKGYNAQPPLAEARRQQRSIGGRSVQGPTRTRRFLFLRGFGRRGSGL